MKFTIELTDAQLRVVNDALDMYSRMGMGQLEIAVEEFLRDHFYKLYAEKEVRSLHHGLKVSAREEVLFFIGKIKELVFDHPLHGSWGIFSPEVPTPSRAAYEIKQITRKALTLWRMETADDEVKKHLASTVDMRDFMSAGTGYPEVTVTWDSRKDADAELGFDKAPVRYSEGRETVDRMRDWCRWKMEQAGHPELGDLAFQLACDTHAMKYFHRQGKKGSNAEATADDKKGNWWQRMSDHVVGKAADPRSARKDFKAYEPMPYEPIRR